MWGGRRLPSTLRLEGVDASIDLTDALDDLSSGIDSGAGAPARASLGGRGDHDPEDIDILIVKADIEILGLPHVKTPAALTEASANIRREGGRWRASFEGTCARGCGAARAVQGGIEELPEGWKANAQVEGGVEIVAPVKGRAVPVSLQGVSISSGSEGFRVEIQRVTATQEFNGWRLDAQIGAIRTTLDGFEPGPIELHQPHVVATRASAPPPKGRAHDADAVNDADAVDDIDAVNDANAVDDVNAVNDVDAVDDVNAVDDADAVDDAGAVKRTGARAKEKASVRARKGGAGGRGVLAALLDVEGFGGRRDAVIEALKGISSRDGVLEIEGERIEGIEARAEGDRAEVGGRWRGGGARVRLERGVNGVDVALEGFDLGALARRVTPEAVDAKGVVSGEVRVRLGPAEHPGVRLEIGGVIDSGALLIPAVAVAPIAVEGASLGLEVSYTPPGPRGAQDRLKVERFDLGLKSRRGGVVKVQASGEIEGISGQRPPVVRAGVWVEEVECDRALGALPEALLPNLINSIEASGRFAPRLDVSVDMRDPEGLTLRLAGLPGSCRIVSLGPHDPAWLNDPFEREVREGVSRAGIKVGPATEGYVALGSMPAYVGAAAYLSEEANFRTNKGFDLGLMRRAVRTNLKEGRYVYGGSSVSQQLVKNLFLSRDKTLSRKLEEALIVWKMESIVSKDRILELYLNCIEFGPDLYGIGPASWHYFGKPASKLSPLEGSFLAAIKPAPWFGERFRKNGQTPSQGWWQSRLEYIMGRLHEKGFIPAEALDEADPYVVRFR